MRKDSNIYFSFLDEAKEFIRQYYIENGKLGVEQRIEEILDEINFSGTYTHSYDELSYGAKLAWRNSNRCIGRLFWKTLFVNDCRMTNDETCFLEQIRHHVKTADRQNKIRNTISIFPSVSPFENQKPVFRIKNYTLIMYAGYKTENGIIGDPKNVEFTDYCKSLGWKGKGTRFDILPVVYNCYEGKDQYVQLPDDSITKINIEHPEHEWFEEMGLQWYKLPIISNMKLRIGGLVYPTCPFNGWYMLDEIATRNLADVSRYNQLPKIALKMGLNMKSPFWKEKTLLVLNEAVYHSFKKAGAMIVDHHTAVKQFMTFIEHEKKEGREVTGDWKWLIPPTSSSLTPIFHQTMTNKIKYPNFIH